MEDSSLRIGLQVPPFTWPDAPDSMGPKLADIGRTADEAGFASLWVMDHFFQIGAVGEVENPCSRATAPSTSWLASPIASN
jgi:alkanesulfonate monooxygenase SsuD/methylene tetrahydromethanopterin reductase-like flavin-dependent oxidoreductase (luciferase family)